ncbi:MAG: lamin tail domain-containing protein [Verrucomicrobia bacterium]|nr:lamin tail domain-containing protein [Verrucomicrobiota bacterium]
MTARVQDPDGIKSLNLAYRLDPDTTFTTTPMKDDGTGGDAVAGDGVFSALIPGPGPNTLVAFYVEAVDASPAAQVSRFPVDAPARECLVRFGEPSPSSGFANYHMYLSAKNVSQWINRPSLSNERVEGTFVYGNFRVIYFIGSKYAGSPYHQGFNTPVTDLCHFSIELPLDDTLLGTENFNKLHSPGNGAGDDGLAQREQTCYWMMRQMDLPYNYRRFVAVFVDGNRKGDFMEDTQTPGTDVVAQRFPNDSNGNLYKLQPWFEFDDVQVIAGGAAGFNNNSWCTLVNFYTGPQQNIKKLARYRYNFLTRAANGTANDYTNVWDLTDAANTLPGGDYVANMKRQANMEQWMRTFAVQHSVGNWDSFGNRNSQNMYGYKPTQGKWTIMTWDFNIVLGNSGSDGPTGDDLFQYQTADDAMLRIYQAPEFRRMYWRALKEITDRVMRDPALNALMDAKYAEITASGRGGSVQSPADIKTWIAARIPYIANQIKPHLTNFTVLGSAAYETNGSVALFSGSAPLEVDHLTVNGVAYPLTWFNPPGTKEIMVTAWRMQVPLAPGDNTLLIQGVDRNGVPIPGLFQVNHVKRTTDLVPPEGRVVINEILYNGLLPESAFIELHNTSATESYDLSGWRLDGVSYKFPPGALLAPKQFLVLAANSTKFERAFSTIARVFDEFTGNLSDSSEVLSLIKPGDTPAQDIVVDRVRYESALPWSPRVYGTGASLQLIDASQDDSRVSNWTDGAQIQWQKVTATATNRGNRLVLFLPFSGDVFVDDVTLVDTNGVDVAKNGGFESPLAGTWFVSTNSVGSDVSAAVAHSGTSSLHLFSKGPGQSSTNFSVWQVTQPILTNSTYTLSFWFLPGPNAVAVVGRTLPSGPLFVSNSVAPMFATPGLPNTVAAPLPAYPPLWLNEVLPYNQNGLADNQGDKDPWIEIYNAGKEALDLTGYFVSDDYGQLKKWAFPAGTTIQAGQFLVIWGDGEPEATAPGFIHTSFSISPTNGAVVLSREIPGGPQIIDYINYPRLDADQAFGSFPDGQPFYRQKLFHVTPGAGNDATPAPVRINEWMAANSSTLANPAGGKFNDWFELYNPSEQTADLSGYFLSENLGNANQFAIPAGTLIPARDHLLVWADKQSSLNAPGAQDLHANFSLDKKNGGIIALFTPSLAVVDKVSFGKQTNDISMGRFPDGAEDIRFMVHPTPRSPNTLGGDGNTPPTITPIPNMVVNENVRLLFTATAEDAESAPAQLTFTLDPGAPAGALILPDGRFRWRPTEAQGPGSYALSVRVTDSGKPGLSAATSFKIKVDEVNQPPAFDQHAHYGQVGKRLAFATAVDPDLPPQRLGFSLPQGAPVGLTVEPASGVVTWTPTADQVGRHAVVVQAVDDGSPPMSAVYSYLIEVFAAGETVIVSEISRAGNQVTLHCNSAAGKSYQLQYKTDLGAASWTPLGDPKLASGADVQFSDAVSGSRRYYRIIEGP